MMEKMAPTRLKTSIFTDNPAREDEASLVARFHQDPAAYAELYRRYVRRVYRYLYSHVSEATEAEDLTAQVFTAALESRSRYRDQGAFAAWLFRIARHKIADHFRRRRPQVSLEGDDPPLKVDWDPLGQLVHTESLQRLSRLVGCLPPMEIELLRLRFAADLTYAEIGAALGQSEAASKMAVRRLLDRLQVDWEHSDE
jgi:RNA polymerase sigma-70 factor (ECF subfamily)